MLSQIAQWLLVDGSSIFLCLWIQGEEPLTAAGFAVSEASWALAGAWLGGDGLLHQVSDMWVFFLGRWFLAFITQAGDWGVTLVLVPRGFGQGLEHDSGHLHV